MSSEIQPPAGAAPPDWRGMCERLVGWAERACSHYIVKPDVLVQAQALLAQDEPEDDVAQLRAALHATAAQRRAEDDARIALAQPEPEVVGPSDESVEAAAQVIYGSMRFDRVDSTSDWVPNGNSFAQDEARRCAHAVLARWGLPTPAPASEPLAQSAYVAFVQICKGNSDDAGTYEKDEELVRNALKRLSELEGPAPLPVLPEDAQPIEPTDPTILVPVPVPVAVSERLPGLEDCDAEGRCWVGYPEWTYGIADTGDTDATTPEWRLERPPLKPKGSRCWWLPAHALPLPSGEVEHG